MATARPVARAFGSAQAFAAWLEKHHAEAAELFVRCRKAGASGRGLTYREALDEALCHGWIDGVRHRLDADSFSVRFTPRKPKSAWSRVNRKRYAELDAEGRIHASGRSAFAAGTDSQYSFETRPQTLPSDFRRRFEANKKAWAFFGTQPPWYRRVCTFWVVSAKRPETRERRLEALIGCCQAGERLPSLKRP